MDTPGKQAQQAKNPHPDTQDIIKILRQAGTGYLGFAKELEELAQRVSHGVFHLAVLGQFKRGKSTLINALLGKQLLPVSILPLTAIPTFIRFGVQPKVEIRYLDPKKSVDEFRAETAEALSEILDKYVTEKHNPQNQLGVSSVDVFTQAKILENGTVLIDTPGVGSTFTHNTRTTMDALPRVDAAMFVVSVDPPITQAELDFLTQVRSGIPTLFFLMNKIDTFSKQEQVLARNFLQEVLLERMNLKTGVFSISAKQGLTARQQNDRILWESSGMKAVDTYINDFLKSNKSNALLQAATIKQARVISRAMLSLQMEEAGLKTPLNELDAKVSLFRDKSTEITQKQRMIEDLIEGEKRRVLKRLEEMCDQLRKKTVNRLNDQMDRAIRDYDADNKTKQTPIARGMYEWVEERLFDMIPGLFGREFNSIHKELSGLIQDAIKRHYQQAGDLIRLIRRNAADLFDIPLHDPESTGDFQVPDTPYWSAREWHFRLGPIPSGLLDRFLPAGVIKKMVKKRMDEDIRLLVNKNVESLRWPMVQAITNRFTAFISRLDKEVSDVISGTDGAIAQAIKLKQERGSEVNARLQVLDFVIKELRH